MSDEADAWSDKDDAALVQESLPESHPSRFVEFFQDGLLHEPPLSCEWLAAVAVTPESVESWGDFSRARSLFRSGLKISTTPLYGIDAPDVSYVRLVETDEHLNYDVDAVPATAHVTLVWRPEIREHPSSAWRIHHIGEAISVESVPRTAVGFDPREVP